MADFNPTGGVRTHLTVAVLTALALVVGLALTQVVTTDRSLITLAAAVAAIHFLAAATYRLSRWRLLRDPHSALAGTALLLVGLVAVPSQSLTALADLGGAGALPSASLRGGACLIAMSLLLRASRTTSLGRRETPLSMLVVSLLGAGVLFAGGVVTEVSMASRGVPAPAASVTLLSLLVALAWLLLAVEMRRRARSLLWAGRLSALLLGMGAAEVLRAVGGEADNGWTLAALLLTGATGWLAMRSAMADLDRASRTTSTVQAHLYEHLDTVTDEVEDFERWRRDLRHDARNTCAGLRAAFAMMDDPRGGLAPEAVGRLHRAAVTELLALEAMLAPEAEPGEAHDVRDPVRRAVDAVRELSLGVRVHAPDPVSALGHPDDLELVVRELLVRAYALPGRQAVPIDVTVEAAADPDTVVVRVGVGGHTPTPGEGEDPGLRAARHLVRRSNGDLTLDPDSGEAVLTLQGVRSLT